MDTCTRGHACSHTHEIKMRHSGFGTLDVWSSLHWSAGLGGHAVQNNNEKNKIKKKKKKDCFVEWHPFPVSGPRAQTPHPGEIKFTLDHIDINGPYEYLHTYAVMAGICDPWKTLKRNTASICSLNPQLCFNWKKKNTLFLPPPPTPRLPPDETFVLSTKSL